MSETTNDDRHPPADVEAFGAEYGEHPLGDLHDRKAVGPYLIELHTNPIGTRRRRRENKPVKAVLTVWKRDTDHWRSYRNEFSEFIGDYGAKEMFRRVDTVAEIEGWIDEYADDDQGADQ
jgi:hypothetical protein